MNLASEPKNYGTHVTLITIVVGALGKRIGTIGKQRKSREHSSNSICEIGQNTEKSPRDQRRLAVTQSLVKANAAVKKTHKE